MDQYLNSLAEFHTGIGDGQVVFVPNNKIANLRLKLHNEENQEANIELIVGKEANLLKEICDVLYVYFGTAWTYDLPILEAFQAVHANNMLKTEYPRNEYGKIIKPNDHPKVDLTEIIRNHREMK